MRRDNGHLLGVDGQPADHFTNARRQICRAHGFFHGKPVGDGAIQADGVTGAT